MAQDGVRTAKDDAKTGDAFATTPQVGAKMSQDSAKAIKFDEH